MQLIQAFTNPCTGFLCLPWGYIGQAGIVSVDTELFHQTQLGKQLRIFQQPLYKNLFIEDPDIERPEKNHLYRQCRSEQHTNAQQQGNPFEYSFHS